MKTYAQEAIERKIFVINSENKTIEETNLFDWVMLSAQGTTSPIGAVDELFYEEVIVKMFQCDGEKPITESDYEHLVSEDDKKYYREIGSITTHCVKLWGFGSGNSAKTVDTFDTVEEADNFIFESIMKFDFENDASRSTVYFYSAYDAQIFLDEENGENEN